MSQPTIEEEPEEEATGEVMAMEEVEVAGKPAAEVVMDEDTTMQEVPEAVPMAEASGRTVGGCDKDVAYGCSRGFAGRAV